MSTQLSRRSVVVGVVLTAIVLAMACPQPAGAQAQVIKQKYDEPIEMTFLAADYPCLTEDVYVVGNLPTIIYTIIDAKGGLHIKFHEVADLTAVGLRTGDRYSTQGPAVSVEHDFEDTSTREFSFVNHVQLIGPGRDGKIMWHYTYHLVVNANGVQTLEREVDELRCR